jgi:hypothetical protein
MSQKSPHIECESSQSVVARGLVTCFSSLLSLMRERRSNFEIRSSNYSSTTQNNHRGDSPTIVARAYCKTGLRRSYSIMVLLILWSQVDLVTAIIPTLWYCRGKGEHDKTWNRQ